MSALEDFNWFGESPWNDCNSSLNIDRQFDAFLVSEVVKHTGALSSGRNAADSISTFQNFFYRRIQPDCSIHASGGFGASRCFFALHYARTAFSKRSQVFSVFTADKL